MYFILKNIMITHTFIFILLLNMCRTFVILPTSSHQDRDLLHLLRNMKESHSKNLNNIHYEIIPRFNEYRRRHHKKQTEEEFNGDEIFNLLSDDLKNDDFKKWLRQQMVQSSAKVGRTNGERTATSFPPVGLHKKEHITILEDEIKNAIVNNDTALYNSPYIEHHGLNDFIVMRPGSTDMFVTVIPNDIYYNIEKKCVNWLDNCDLQGIRQELLTKIESP